MPENILDIITERYNSFTNTGKKLAKYIMDNKSKVPYLSITSLAENSKVSEATITRFCRDLGTTGYNNFKLALSKTNGVAIIGHVSEPSSSITKDEGLESICNKLFSTHVAALKETLELVNETETTNAVNYLNNANRVYCFGQGASNIMAEEAWARFATISNKFIHIADSHMQTITASLCTPKDVILFFSYSGATKEMPYILKTAKEHGTKIILITHFFNSPAAAFSDTILLCGSKESPLQSGSVAARIGQLFIIDYLFYGYCQKNPDFSSSALEATAEAIASKLL